MKLLTNRREYDKLRSSFPHRKKYKKRQHRAWKEANPEKYRAQTLVNNSLRDGKLVRQPCVVCGDTQVHGHHEDYSKPLDVTWLCHLHHMEVHSENND